MKQYPMKLITIVTESVLEHYLEDDLDKLGVHGYTIVDARGKGQEGLRDDFWSNQGNIRIEIVCDEKMSDTVSEYLYKNYYSDYAMMLYISDVNVLRNKKF